jgi:inosine/xanthosine triphosphate pyrophosphatase family protein
VLSFSTGKGQEVKSFVGIVEGSIVYPRIKQGTQVFGWDPIFMVISMFIIMF